LVDGIHDDKHVVNSDSDQQERQQVVDSSDFLTQGEADSLARKVGEQDSQQTLQS